MGIVSLKICPRRNTFSLEMSKFYLLFVMCMTTKVPERGLVQSSRSSIVRAEIANMSEKLGFLLASPKGSHTVLERRCRGRWEDTDALRYTEW